MVRHQQPLDDLALYDMAFHDFRHVRFVADPVPHALRIDDHAGAEVAMVQASGLVGAHDALQIEAFDFLLEKSMQAFRATGGAAAARVVRRPLVDTDKNVAFERGHGPSPGLCRGGPGLRLHPLQQGGDIGRIEHIYL